ncbi:hypothetical protein ACFWBB_26175 [Streptomyces sp. NPDC060000]|uniref:hypothetical protein n=1 Tax=Streptomyces sp. NPDC060000 TaxID=3347031 RepID=UPI00368FB1D4
MTSYTQHQLKSRTRDLCLTTDNHTDRNAGWLSACVGRLGQHWDNGIPDSLRSDTFFNTENTLRVSPTSTAVYSSNSATDYVTYDIPNKTHFWWATAHS